MRKQAIGAHSQRHLKINFPQNVKNLSIVAAARQNEALSREKRRKDFSVCAMLKIKSVSQIKPLPRPREWRCECKLSAECCSAADLYETEAGYA